MLKKLAISIFLLAILTSCKKFLEVKPENSVSDKVTIVDKASSETALRGVYNSLASSGYYGTSFQSIGYLSGDNLSRTGPNIDASQFIDHLVTADNGTINSAWNAIYSTINRANNVIAKVPDAADVKFTPAIKNQIIGEAYFIRGLAYFDLARTWGGVPIIKDPTANVNDNTGIKRSSLQETYEQALNDLKLAEPLLSETVNRIRVTKKTVRALLARYYLYQEDWKLAEDYAATIIKDSVNFRLIAPYASFWANNVSATPESIFELGYNAAFQNTHRGNWQPPEKGGTRVWIPNTVFTSLIQDSTKGGNRKTLVAKTTGGLLYGNMYYRSPATDPSYIIRIAEIFLIRAEARVRQGNTEGAVKDLNLVRKRAGLPGSTATTADEILLAIENERRLEFAYEPHRWYDLVRTGRAAAVLGITNPNKLLMPIPVSQINADITTVQNPGY